MHKGGFYSCHLLSCIQHCTNYFNAIIELRAQAHAAYSNVYIMYKLGNATNGPFNGWYFEFYFLLSLAAPY